jgi:hypothetical protein
VELKTILFKEICAKVESKKPLAVCCTLRCFETMELKPQARCHRASQERCKGRSGSTKNFKTPMSLMRRAKIKLIGDGRKWRKIREVEKKMRYSETDHVIETQMLSDLS